LIGTPVRPGFDPDFSLMPELFPSSMRPHVRAFGRFVRLADGITDSALLGRQDKLARLTALERCLDGSSEAAVWSVEAGTVVDALRASLRQSGISPEHARHVLQAFRRDAQGYVSATWRDILTYCQFAAAPIGRYMLQLVGEDLAVCGRPADALCAALRILRQLRDCGDPTIRYNRLCIPRQFLDDAMITPDHLRVPTAKGQTRAVLNRVLDGVEQLLIEASPLPRLVHNRGFAMHTAIVLCRARKLVTRFRRQDPLQERVGLAAWQRTLCRWFGTLRGLVRW
jgi:phytoene/squalene synthetase